MIDGSKPRASGRSELFASFLEGAETVLAGQIDRSGVVVSANPLLQRWLGAEPPAPLEPALLAMSRRRWRAFLDQPERWEGVSRLVLRFGADPSRASAFRCMLAPDDGERLWLIGERILGCRPWSSDAVQAIRDELEMARRRARRLARTDALTGLPNRRQADRWLARLTERALDCRESLACLMVDLDRFKEVNDTLGHPVGDRVLKEAARALADGLRSSDRLARYGGEEFMILLPGTGSRSAFAVAERLRVLLASRPVEPLGGALTASFGVAALGIGELAESLLARADAALLRAKRNGRDRVELADPVDSCPEILPG